MGQILLHTHKPFECMRSAYLLRTMTNLKIWNSRNCSWKSEKLEQHFCSTPTKFKHRNQVSTPHTSLLETAFCLLIEWWQPITSFLQIIFRNEVASRMTWEWRNAWSMARQPLNSFGTIWYRAYTMSSNWTTEGRAEGFMSPAAVAFIMHSVENRLKRLIWE